MSLLQLFMNLNVNLLLKRFCCTQKEKIIQIRNILHGWWPSVLCTVHGGARLELLCTVKNYSVKNLNA